MADSTNEALVAREKDDEDSGLSMLDVLEEEEALEDVANAVLGDSDDKNCTYDMGYVSRQALYACATCISDKSVFAGVCLACSYECHEGHDLIELYTKRNFRCDCGNSKFPNMQCKLTQDKASVNENNRYGQNFHGLYCTCSRPYPDPDDKVEDEMYQCIVCEDWLHGRHLGSAVPEDNCGDMICAACVGRHSFLQTYAPADDQEDIPIETIGSAQIANNSPKKSPKSKPSPSAKNGSPKKAASSPLKAGSDAGTSSAAGAAAVSQNGAAGGCVLKELQQRTGVATWQRGAVFVADDWRASLCQCKECQAMYDKAGLSFLPCESDTIENYENRGKAKTCSQYENGMKVLSDMDRTQQVEMLTEYNGLKTELTDYLKKFADNKKMVREEDIREFFADLSARKKQKTSGGGMQYFCK